MAAARPTRSSPTPERILDVAEKLVQTRGFNGFSYADVAVRLEVSKAALHYHFRSKAELGEALIRRYAARFQIALTDIDAHLPEGRPKLEAYVDLYGGVLQNKRMCLCGILAAEYQTLPRSMRTAVVEFFDVNQAWVCDVLTRARDAGALHFEGSPDDVARTLISGLEGAMLVARPYSDPSRFHSAAGWLLTNLRD